MLKRWSIGIFFAVVLVGCDTLPEYETPSKHYHPKHLNLPIFDQKQNATNGAESKTSERIQRLGVGTAVGFGGLNSFSTPSVGIGAYAPARLNLAGVVLSTLLGIGAILIFPKLLTMFSGGDSLHKRSAEDNLSTITQMLTNIDEVLRQNKINSTNCMQRAVCSYMRSTESRIERGSGDLIDQFMHTLSSNSLVAFMLNGTSVKDALENAKEIDGKECDAIYLDCTLNLSSTLKVLSRLLPG